LLNYPETSEDVHLATKQHIGLKKKNIEILVYLTFKKIEKLLRAIQFNVTFKIIQN